MIKNAITFAVLCARLERAIHCDVGMRGFKILLYGWTKKYKLVNYSMLHTRKKVDGEIWLSQGEARSLSNYAGYDLLND